MPSSVGYTIVVEDVPVRVVLKHMKSIRLRVSPTGKVSVSAPYGTSEARIRSFVSSKLGWVRQQQAAQANSPVARAERATKQEVEQWRTVVKACVPPLVAEWEHILGVRVQKLDYRNMKSRWGSLSAANGAGMHQHSSCALSSGMPGVRGGSRAVPYAGAESWRWLQSPYDQGDARLETARTHFESAVGNPLGTRKCYRFLSC